MVRHHHPGRARLQAGQGVVAAQHPFDQHRQAGPLGQPADHLGGEPGVELAGLGERVGVQLALAGGPGRGCVGRLQPGGQPEVVAQVAEPVAEHGHVHGQDQRPVAGGGRPRDQLGRPAAVADHVHLEPAQAVGDDLGHLLDRHGGLGREDVAGPGGGRPGGRGGLAVGMGHAVIGHGRHQQRDREPAAEHGGGHGDLGHVAQDPGPQPQPRPGGLGVGDAALVVGAAGDIVVDPALQPLPGRGLQCRQVQGVERVAHGPDRSVRLRPGPGTAAPGRWSAAGRRAPPSA